MTPLSCMLQDYLLSSSVIVTTVMFGPNLMMSGSVVVRTTEKLSSSSRIKSFSTIIIAQSRWEPFPGLKVSCAVSNEKSPGATENNTNLTASQVTKQ